MPLLGTLLVNIGGALVAWFARFAAQRMAFYAAAVALVVGAFLVLKAAIAAIVAGLNLAIPPDLATAMTWIVPPVLDDCIGASLAAELAIAIYKWQYNILLRGATAT